MDRSGHQRNTSENPWFKILAVLISGLFNSVCFANRILIDKTVADVGGSPILYSEIKAKIQRGQEIVVTEYPASATASDFEKSLQDQINFELIMQKADALDINVDDDKLDTAIQKVLNDRHVTVDEVKESLRRDGMSFEDYRSDFRDQMILREFQGKVIFPLVKVTDKDVENHYIKKMGQGSQSVTVKLRQITFPVSSSANASERKEVLTRADEAYAALKAGKSFQDVLTEFSKDPAAIEAGGLMSDIPLGELNTELKSRIEPLSTGEFTAPVDLGPAIAIFQLEERSVTGSSDYEQKKPQLEAELRNKELTNQTLRWLADQRRRAQPKVIN